MTSRKYLQIIFCGTILLLCFSFAVVRQLPEMMYFDEEYPAWLQQKDYVNSYGEKSEILFLGDSALKAGIIPQFISDNSYNLALGGAGPIEMYYTLEHYLENHPRPEKIFISISPMHFNYLKRYHDRTLYFHYLNETEQIESQENIFRLDGTEFLERMKLTAENKLFNLRFPTQYYHTIKNSLLLREPSNEKIYENVKTERGHQFFGLNPEWLKTYEPHEQLTTNIHLRPSLKFYMSKILELCKKNDVQVFMIQTPINSTTYATASQYEYFEPYQKYLSELSAETGVPIETELVFYEESLFGDALHLNYYGAKKFTAQIKQKYDL